MTEPDLRALVREVLREALSRKAPPPPPAATDTVETVVVASDADLAAFVGRLVALLDDPAAGPALRAGRRRFTLAAARPAAGRAAPADAVVTLDGPITEARIARLAGTRAVRLGPNAVLTPLARDKARALGITIERRR